MMGGRRPVIRLTENQSQTFLKKKSNTVFLLLLWSVAVGIPGFGSHAVFAFLRRNTNG